MGRKLAFNRQKALETAMENFWSKGYEATSMRALAENTGLRIGSVYNTLGPKEKLFEESLHLYCEKHVAPRLRQMTAQPDAFAALDAAMERVAAECARPGEHPGCFIVNSMHEIGGINESVGRLLDRILSDKEKAYAACIAAAQAAGKATKMQSAQELARFLIAIQFSMRLMAKIGVPAQKIREIKNSTMELLKAAPA